MAGSKAKKIIQIPIEDELLERIDSSAGTAGQSRAAFIRVACKQHLERLAAEKLDRHYMASYQKKSENFEWAKESSELLSKRLPREESLTPYHER